jgi:uncharacterized protein (TIGR02246 family)
MKRFLLITILLSALSGLALAQNREADIKDFFKAYDAAFNAKDLAKLATMYHADVTIFEGAGINRGWVDYRDNHLGPELRNFQDLQFAHSNIVVHALGDSSAYVTADYTIKYKTGERSVDSGGIATHILVREQGAWKIRHSHTAARRTPQRGGQ